MDEPMNDPTKTGRTQATDYSNQLVFWLNGALRETLWKTLQIQVQRNPHRAPGGWWSSASRRAAACICIGVNPRRASLLSAAPRIPAITWEETANACPISKAE